VKKRLRLKLAEHNDGKRLSNRTLFMRRHQ